MKRIKKAGAVLFAFFFIVSPASPAFASENAQSPFPPPFMEEEDKLPAAEESFPDGTGEPLPEAESEIPEAAGEEQAVLADDTEAKLQSLYVPLNTEEHVRYIDGKNNGLFLPNAPITRAETAKIIYMLLRDPPPVTGTVFPDAPGGKWYTDYVNALASLEIIQGSGGLYRPDDYITRAEFVTIVSRFYPPEDGNLLFTDVNGNHWAKNAIISAAVKGWISGYGDGSFKPGNKITRAEAVAIVNRAVGRTGDEQVIRTRDYRLFPDVNPDEWFYTGIMEAAVTHTHETNEDGEAWTDHTPPQTILSPGFHSIGGELYHVNDSLLFSHSMTIDGFLFSNTCRYTTGDRELDALLTTIVVNQSGTQGREQLLYRVYLYTRDRFDYFVRPLIAQGSAEWETMRALEMIKTGKGNCYSFAGTFYHLARKLGYDARTVIGTYGGSPHCWVEIEFDGIAYVFDTQLEKRYYGWGDYTYNFYKATYDTLPDLYKK